MLTLNSLKIAICAAPLLVVPLYPRVVVASTFHHFTSDTSQITVAQAPGIGFSNIRFVETTRAEKQVRDWALKIEGTLTNLSNSPIRARAITYDIIAFNGRQYEVVVRNTEFLIPSMKIVILEPGDSIPFIHSLDSEQMASLSRYIVAPDIFTFQVVGTTNEVIDKLPVD